MMRKDKKAKAKPANGHKLADPLPAGQIFTDLHKQNWQLGKSIGVGGFGQIYSASDDLSKPVGPNATYVIKVEPHTNGPLFTEIHFYQRAAKTEMIEEWKKNKKLKFLGMPKFVGLGSHEYKNNKYRFLVMERFGDDLQKHFEANGRQFSIKTVLTLGIKILDILEYIHSNGYVHCDVKASNLLLGFTDKTDEKVYLVDFGLACRYLTSDGKHKPFNPDPKKAHDGTIEFTSRDAHIGAFSRRGDLEILGFNMLQWSCGELPWENNLQDCEGVKNKKINCLENLSKMFKKMNIYPGLKQYFEYVIGLGFEETPNYDYCRKLLKQGLKEAGLKDDGKLDVKNVVKMKRTRVKKESENELEVKAVKPIRTSARKPCAPAQSNRVLRSSPAEKLVKKDDGLDNPTPAMLLIMEKKRLKEEKAAMKAVKRPTPPSTKRTKRIRRDVSPPNYDISPDLF